MVFSRRQKGGLGGRFRSATERRKSHDGDGGLGKLGWGDGDWLVGGASWMVFWVGPCWWVVDGRTVGNVRNGRSSSAGVL